MLAMMPVLAHNLTDHTVEKDGFDHGLWFLMRCFIKAEPIRYVGLQKVRWTANLGVHLEFLMLGSVKVKCSEVFQRLKCCGPFGGIYPYAFS